MKVLVVSSYSPSLVNFRGHFLRELVRRGHTVYASAPSSSNDSQVTHQLQSLGVRYLSYKANRSAINIFSDFRLLLSLYKQIDSIKPTHVCAYTLKPVIYTGIILLILNNLSLLSRPISFYPLITGLGYCFTTGNALFKRFVLRQIIKFLYFISFKSASTIIFQNPDDLSLFDHLGLYSDSVSTACVNGSGVDLSVFQPQPMPSKVSFLLLSRLIADKGVNEYFEAAKLVKAKYPDVKFRLAGMFDSNHSSISPDVLESYINSGSIEYLGESDSVSQLLKECSVFVFPSYREGTPRSVLEALATARPVICTDVPGCRQTVIHGVNGLLVPPRNATELAEAILKMLDLPPFTLQMMGLKSRLLCEEYFDVTKVTSSLISIMGL